MISTVAAIALIIAANQKHAVHPSPDPTVLSAQEARKSKQDREKREREWERTQGTISWISKGSKILPKKDEKELHR